VSIGRGGLLGRGLAWWLVGVCGLLLAGGLAGSARAAVSYEQQTLPFSAGYPVGVAVDSGADVFATDDGGAFGYSAADAVNELPAGGLPSPVDSTSAFLGLVATDADGDVFVADSNSNSNDVLEFKSPVTADESPKVIPVTGGEAFGVAVDRSGDLFITDFSLGDVYELTAVGGGLYDQSTVLTGLNEPTGVALDQAGDLFVGDTGDGEVLELPETDLTDPPPGGYTLSSNAVTAIATGLPGPYGVAVDEAGNVYVAESYSSDVVELSQTDGSFTGSVLPFTGLAEPLGVAVDQYGDVFTVDGLGGGVVELGVDQSQSITWATSASYTYPGSGSLTETLDASASSGLAVSYKVVGSSSVCSVSGSTLTITGAGTCELAADQAGGFHGTEAFSAAGEVDQQVTIKGSQSITWTQQLGPYVVGAGPIALDASATPSNLPVSYTATGPCSVSGSRLTPAGAGVCKVTASQAGNSQYLQASSVQRSVVIEYGFERFIAPLWHGTFQPGATIPVRFELSDAAGDPIPIATAVALGKAGEVQAVLSGPGITVHTAACGWYLVVFECSVKTPETVKTGTGNPYTITAQENVGGGFLTAPPIGPAKNPDTIYFN
jgi:streptogramin lyase